MEFTVLGPVAVVRRQHSVNLGGPRQQSVLALLLVAANRVVPIDRFIDEIWGESLTSGARDTLQVYISKLRKELGPERIEQIANGYLLRVEPGELDADSFETEVASAVAVLESAPDRARYILSEALSRWQGDPYQGIDAPSVRVEASRLAERRLAAMEDHLTVRLELGQHHQAVGELLALCEEYPLRERLWGLTMLALYRDGRQAEALAAYQKLRRLLAEQLGIDPSEELQTIEEQILLHDSRLEREIRIPHNVPASLTSFVGRKAELLELGKLLADARLITIAGAGGSGKTRLALEVARAAMSDFPDGVWLVELDRVRTPGAVTQALCNVLGLPFQAGAEGAQMLSESLKARRMLIVLDNFEQVMEAAPLVSRLLKGSSELRVLVTSREPLALSGERIYNIPPLAESDATALFLQRAQAVQPGISLEEEAGRVAVICRSLDFLPLPIELAAARANVLPLTDLWWGLGSRLDKLKAELSDSPARHQTLRATIEWSYELLERGDQELLAALAVFDGGFTMEAAATVCRLPSSPDMSYALELLTKKNLILRRPGPGGRPRFSMLNTIYEFAVERLHEDLDIRLLREAHCDYFAEYLEREGPALRFGADSEGGLRILEAEMANMRAALEWAFTEGDPRQGARMLGSFHFHREDEGWSELEEWKEKALDLANALDPAARAGLCLELAHSHSSSIDARDLCSQALTWATEAGDQVLIARARFSLAWTYAGDEENYEMAISLCREAIEEARAANAPGLVAHAINSLGELARSHGDDLMAGRAYEEALQISRQVGNRTLSIILLLNLAFVAEHLEDHSSAEHLAAEALRDAVRRGDQTLIALSLEGAAIAAISAGRSSRGARLLAATDDAYTTLGITRYPADALEYERGLQRIVELLEPARLEKLFAEGHAMTTSEAVSYALDHGTER